MKHFLTAYLLFLSACHCRGESGPYIDEDADGFYTNPPDDTPADCDDMNANIHPAADELCNGIDDDCNDAVDDAAIDATAWYLDADGDDFGEITDTPTLACAAPEGFVEATGDCDDEDRHAFPNVVERCNDKDDDCDGDVDEAPNVTIRWYADEDGDGHGAGSVLGEDCFPEEGWSESSLDCDDSNATVHPDAEEICDLLDNDCNELADEDDPNLVPIGHPQGPTFNYTDLDGDGWGEADGTEYATCFDEPGRAKNLGDCDETDPTLNGGTTWYLDADGDGFGHPNSPWSQTQCTSPVDPANPDDVYVRNAEDCDDTDAELSDHTGWYYDADDDGVGVASDFDGDGVHDEVNVFGCIEGDYAASAYGDCDDFDATVTDDSCTTESNEGLVEVEWTADGDPGAYGRDTRVGVACVEFGEDPEDTLAPGFTVQVDYLDEDDANTTGTSEFELPTGLRCYLTMSDRNRLLDPSGDGSPTLTVTTCDGQSTGISAWTAPDDTHAFQFDTNAFIVPDCSGCTDSLADNYAAGAMIDDGSCTYAP